MNNQSDADEMDDLLKEDDSFWKVTMRLHFDIQSRMLIHKEAEKYTQTYGRPPLASDIGPQFRDDFKMRSLDSLVETGHIQMRIVDAGRLIIVKDPNGALPNG